MAGRRVRTLLSALLWLAVGVGLGLVGPRLVRPAPVPAADAAVAGVAAEEVELRLRTDAGRYLDIGPGSGAVDTILVVYPGGLVGPEAYSWLGVALAPFGVRTLIPEMPFDLAVLAPRRLDGLLRVQNGWDGRVVLAGHSLGGVMAARYALRGDVSLDGLVLMAAFGAQGDDLSDRSLPTLVLAASEDGLTTTDEIVTGLARLPGTTDLVTIEGAVHSYFGRYGPQQGDGLPTLPRAAAERQIVAALQRFVQDLPGPDTDR